jgi:hypothetical protein
VSSPIWPSALPLRSGSWLARLLVLSLGSVALGCSDGDWAGATQPRVVVPRRATALLAGAPLVLHERDMDCQH